MYEDSLSSLLQVKHTRKVQDYIYQYKLALSRVTFLLKHSLNIFLVGLDHHTHMHVHMFNTSFIIRVANIAKLHEASQPSS